MERNLLVPTVDKAVELMKAYLSSQLIEADVLRDDGKESPYFVKLAWLYKDSESDVRMGCPCFVADFKGKQPDGTDVKGVIYVKCFPTQTTRITNMVIVNKYLPYGIYFIDAGDMFVMRDPQGRYKDEAYLFTGKEIVLKNKL